MGLPVTSDKGGQARDQELQCHNGFAPSPASPCSLLSVTQPPLTPLPSPVCLLSAACGRARRCRTGSPLLLFLPMRMSALLSHAERCKWAGVEVGTDRERLVHVPAAALLCESSTMLLTVVVSKIWVVLGVLRLCLHCFRSPWRRRSPNPAQCWLGQQVMLMQLHHLQEGRGKEKRIALLLCLESSMATRPLRWVLAAGTSLALSLCWLHCIREVLPPAQPRALIKS